MSKNIFKLSSAGRSSTHFINNFDDDYIPSEIVRKQKPRLPEVSEMDVVRHYTRLSRKNFSIDGEFYPLGSCTMKYNPKGIHILATQPHVLSRHPMLGEKYSQGFLACMYKLQENLALITGMHSVSLTPMAGAQGEFAGVAMIKAYHADKGLIDKDEMLIPDSAHGTNPASAYMCGYKIREIKTLANGDLDIDDLKDKISDRTAGLMLTNPSTLGIFERNIQTITDLVHKVDGILYYDGANLNAILGRVCPGNMGFDVMHLNLHKTFATPHGGGGPGSGPVACSERLAPYLPTPIVVKDSEDKYVWATYKDRPKTIGRLSTFMGNAGVLLRAHLYIELLGSKGLKEVSDIAALNANYLKSKLAKLGLQLSHPDRMATHEFIVTFKQLAKEKGITALDMAKRLLDFGVHAPTMYFPLIVPECWLLEPTETESPQTLDSFVNIISTIVKEAESTPELLKSAPNMLELTRLDEVKAVRELNITALE